MNGFDKSQRRPMTERNPFLPSIAQPSGDTCQPDPAEMIDVLHGAFGSHHARAVHAKGILLRGVFEPSSQSQNLCVAGIFALDQVPLLIRFSNFTGIPSIPDTSPLANPRGLAIRFDAVGDERLDIVSHSFNGFPTKTAEGFMQLLRALGTSRLSTASPSALDEFLTQHPIARVFLTTQKPSPSSYATISYFGVNSVTFTNGSGVKTAVRYRFVPRLGEFFLSPREARDASAAYLQEEILNRLAFAPVTFDWFAQVAQRGDVVEDPSVAWPENRRLIRLGEIRVIGPALPAEALDRETVFLPGTLPHGIAAADPMIDFRNATYPLSFQNRR